MRLAAFKEQRQLSLDRMAGAGATLANVQEETALSATMPAAMPAASAAATHTNAAAAAAAAANAGRPSDDLLGMFEGATEAPAQAANSGAWQAPPTNPFGEKSRSWCRTDICCCCR